MRAREIVKEDKENGLAAFVIQNDDGRWFGGLLDTDCNRVVPGGCICKTREAAVAFALSTVQS